MWGYIIQGIGNCLGFIIGIFLLIIPFILSKAIKGNKYKLCELKKAFVKYKNKCLKDSDYEDMHLVDKVIENLNNDIQIKEVNSFKIESDKKFKVNKKGLKLLVKYKVKRKQ